MTIINQLYFFAILIIFTNISSAVTETERTQLLDRHNFHRSQVAQGLVGSQPSATNMIQLSWDEDLETVAQNYSDQCTFGNNSNRQNEYEIESGVNTLVGENFYITSVAQSAVPTAGPDAWASSESDYEYGTNSCLSSPFSCLNYTQLVWANTDKLGCGLTFCPTLFGTGFTNVNYLVCNYVIAGNFNNQLPYEAGAVASNCPVEFPDNIDGLCSLLVTAVNQVNVPMPRWALVLLTILLLITTLKIRRIYNRLD